MVTKLLTNQTANGSSAAFNWSGGAGHIEARGTFDTSSLLLEYLGIDGSWYSVPGTTALTAGGLSAFTLSEATMRVTLSSVGASTDVDAAVRGPDRS